MIEIRPRTPAFVAALAAAAVVAAVLVVPAAVAAEGDGSSPSEDHPLLEQARRNVEEVTASLERARGDRQASRRALATIEERLLDVEQAVNDAAAAVQRQEMEVAVAGERLTELQSELDVLEERIEDRSVRLYMGASGSPVEGLLSSGELRDAVDRSSYLGIVSSADQVSHETAASARRALTAATERFDAETARLVRMRDDQQQLLAEIEELRAARLAALEESEAEIADLERQQDDLAGEYDRVSELIASGRATAVAASPPSAEGYGWPTCTAINSRFGYRWGRLHQGIDLAGDVGDPIAAAKAGTVLVAGYQGGYGNLVLIDHGDGVVTAYGHQSEMLVAPGQSVDRGQLIGLVGNTGRSTGPHLHFETRVNGTAVDPLQYLPDGC